jgi:parallel beta-helix repeat protein
MRKKIIGIIVCTLMIWTVLPMSASVIVQSTGYPASYGDTLYVGGSGPGNYTSIQDAMDDANDGDTVFVYDDSSPYLENVFIDQSVNLVGENRDSTIIDGNKIDDVIHITADFVNINGFTIKNSGTEYDPNDILNSDSGVDIQSNYVNVSNNIISNNYIGLSTRGSSSKNDLTVHNNVFIDNSEGGEKGNPAIDFYACYLLYTDYSKIHNNEFYHNDNGIRLSNSDYNEINDNKIINLTDDNLNAICLKDSSYNRVYDNHIKNSYFGIWIYSFGDINEANAIYDNTIEQALYGLSMQFCMGNNVNGNLIKNNEHGISLNYSYGNVFYHNDFINNDENAYDDEVNNWYNDSIEEGNYWHDYLGEDEDQNGIGDTPYNIKGGVNQDIFPLMKPYNNLAPEKPDIDGPTKGGIGKKLDYNVISTDLNDDEIFYIINWGDNQEEEFGPYPSGETFTASHVWDDEGSYVIKAKSMDIHSSESDWTTLDVSIPRNRESSRIETGSYESIIYSGAEIIGNSSGTYVFMPIIKDGYTYVRFDGRWEIINGQYIGTTGTIIGVGGKHFQFGLVSNDETGIKLPFISQIAFIEDEKYFTGAFKLTLGPRLYITGYYQEA